MPDGIRSFWRRAFLEERPSAGLALFRPFAAFTVGAHLIPTLLQMRDNYLAGSFREKNPSFFTDGVLLLVDKSPDWLIWLFAVLFYLSVTSFFVGFFSQISCILLTLSCYYFYALNSLHIGTLSYDILLVTLFLLCVTGYPGDSFSLDSLGRAEPRPWERKRPFFIQRLLQLQIASTYFFTALCKFTASGNWLTDNPIYYLVHSVPEGVVKEFTLRGFFARHETLCYWTGVGVIAFEISLPFLLFNRRTREAGIAMGVLFHILLVATLHVPTIFFFLFVPQLFLFIAPEAVTAGIEKKRAQNESARQEILVFDGHCRFCVMSVRRLGILDILSQIKLVDYQTTEDLAGIDPRLRRELCHSRLQLGAKNGKLYEGFAAFRYLSRRLPLLWAFMPVFHLPGMGFFGAAAYDFIAKNRYLFHRRGACKDNRCFVTRQSPRP